jgi:hypothetical protein
MSAQLLGFTHRAGMLSGPAQVCSITTGRETIGASGIASIQSFMQPTWSDQALFARAALQYAPRTRLLRAGPLTGITNLTVIGRKRQGLHFTSFRDDERSKQSKRKLARSLPHSPHSWVPRPRRHAIPAHDLICSHQDFRIRCPEPSLHSRIQPILHIFALLGSKPPPFRRAPRAWRLAAGPHDLLRDLEIDYC